MTKDVGLKPHDRTLPMVVDLTKNLVEFVCVSFHPLTLWAKTRTCHVLVPTVCGVEARALKLHLGWRSVSDVAESD